MEAPQNDTELLRSIAKKIGYPEAVTVLLKDMEETELLGVNKFIISEIDYKRNIRSAQQYAQYKSGREVEFQRDGPESAWIPGIVRRCNEKTVSVKDTSTGQHWAVPFKYCRPIIPRKEVK